MKSLLSLCLIFSLQNCFCQDISVEHFKYWESRPHLYPPIRNIGPHAKHFEQEFAIEMRGFSVTLYKITYDSVKQLLNLKGRVDYVWTDSLGHSDTSGIDGEEIYWGKPGPDKITGIINVGISHRNTSKDFYIKTFMQRDGDFDITTKLYPRKCLFFVRPSYKLLQYDFIYAGVLEYLGINYKIKPSPIKNAPK